MYSKLAYTMLALESRAILPNNKSNIILCIAKEFKYFWFLMVKLLLTHEKSSRETAH